jgi:hypothetical protein
MTRVKKECLDSKKTLQSLQLSKSQIPSLSSEGPSERPGHSLVSNINNDAFNQGFSQFSKVFFRYVYRRFCTDFKTMLSDPLHPSGRRGIPSGRSSVKQHPSARHDIPSKNPTVQSIICPDDENFPSRPSSMSRSFELYQLASVRTFQ